MSVLAVRDVSKRFPTGLVALESVNLDIVAGEIVALIGASGCGKSTLLRLVAGLDVPSAGTVTIAGHQVSGPGADVGVVFQEPRLMPWLSVADNVSFGIGGLPRDQVKAMVAEAVARVGLGDFADALPRELSGGMSQRVAIARALVVKPPVLLLDEPFSALDAFTRHDLQEHLLELWGWYKPTLLLVTHDLDEAVTLADRIVIMSGQPGRLAGDVRVTLERPRHRTDSRFSRLREEVLGGLGEAGSQEQAALA